jgi:hypothetical protein
MHILELKNIVTAEYITALVFDGMKLTVLLYTLQMSRSQ